MGYQGNYNFPKYFLELEILSLQDLQICREVTIPIGRYTAFPGYMDYGESMKLVAFVREMIIRSFPVFNIRAGSFLYTSMSLSYVEDVPPNILLSGSDHSTSWFN